MVSGILVRVFLICQWYLGYLLALDFKNMSGILKVLGWTVGSSDQGHSGVFLSNIS